MRLERVEERSPLDRRRGGMDERGRGGEDERRRGGVDERRSGGVDERRRGGVDERRSGGEDERRRGGVEEWMKGGEEEWRSEWPRMPALKISTVSSHNLPPAAMIKQLCSLSTTRLYLAPEGNREGRG
jgi:hypothetical protein